MSGILSSCCPFLTNAVREGRGSPPYSADAVRLRLHNWTNSLSGATQIPHQVSASADDKPGLPDMSAGCSAITFVKSETSVDPREGEGECRVILPAREGCEELDRIVAAAVAADFHPAPDGDWEAEKGLEEEEVTLFQKRQTEVDELDVTCLERKAAKTVLSLKRQADRPAFELSAAIPFKSKVTSNATPLPDVLEEPAGRISLPGAELIAPSHVLPEEAPELSTSEERPTTPSAAPEPSEEPPPSPSDPRPTSALLVEDPTQASSSSELLDAISSLSAARGAGKFRRSRMTTTRAPTPWTEGELDVEQTEPSGLTAEAGQLERVDSSSSGSSWPFESVPDTVNSSYHTLPTASNSEESAGRTDQPAALNAARADRPSSGHVITEGSETTAPAVGGQTVQTPSDTETGTEEPTGQVSEETTLAGAAEVMETGTTEETSAAEVTETAARPETASAAGAATNPAAEPTSEPLAESAAEPAITPAATAEGAPCGDHPSHGVPAAGAAAAAAADDVNLRYFCGAFRPVDHHMTRYAGLEEAAPAPAPLAVLSGRSEGAVRPAVGSGAGRRRAAASDSTLPSGVRGCSPRPPPDGDDSGVQLEAKRSSTAIPL